MRRKRVSACGGGRPVRLQQHQAPGRGVAPVLLRDEGMDGRKNGGASVEGLYDVLGTTGCRRTGRAQSGTLGVLVGDRGRKRVAGHGHREHMPK